MFSLEAEVRGTIDHLNPKDAATVLCSEFRKMAADNERMKLALESVVIHADHRGITELRLPHCKRMMALARIAAENALAAVK